MIYSHLEQRLMRRTSWRRILKFSSPFHRDVLIASRPILVFELLSQPVMAHMGLSQGVLYNMEPTMATCTSIGLYKYFWFLVHVPWYTSNRPIPWPKLYDAIIYFSTINHHVSNIYCIIKITRSPSRNRGLAVRNSPRSRNRDLGMSHFQSRNRDRGPLIFGSRAQLCML